MNRLCQMTSSHPTSRWQRDAAGSALRPLRVRTSPGTQSYRHSRPGSAAQNTPPRYAARLHTSALAATASNSQSAVAETHPGSPDFGVVADFTAQAAPAGDADNLPTSRQTADEGSSSDLVVDSSDASRAADTGASVRTGDLLSAAAVATADATACTAPAEAAVAAAATAAAPADAMVMGSGETSISGSNVPWPGAGRGRGRGGRNIVGGRGVGGRNGGGGGRAAGGGRSAQAGTQRGPGRQYTQPMSPPTTPPPPPPYAGALTNVFILPRVLQDHRSRPAFLEAYPVPPGKTFNVNSFLGKRDPHGGQYLVPGPQYREFLESYAAALEEGYALYLTENYHQRVYKFFLELDWDWDTDLALVMEVTPQLLVLAEEVARDFYRVQYGSTITSIRTPYKVHLNFPALLTTELLACQCRDRLLEACTARLGPRYGSAVDWERLIDFPHGSLRLMGSRKASHMDSDPAWVREKAYHPARLTPEGRWQPGRITPALLAAASIFPTRRQVAAFEKSPAYLDLIFTDLEAYQKKIEERRLERARRREQREQQQQQQQQDGNSSGGARGSTHPPNLPPGSSRNPLYVRLEVQPDDTVSLKVHIKSKFRTRGQQKFNFTSTAATGAAATPTPAEQPTEQVPESAAAATGTAAAPDAVAALALAESGDAPAAGTGGAAPESVVGESAAAGVLGGAEAAVGGPL